MNRLVMAPLLACVTHVAVVTAASTAAAQGSEPAPPAATPRPVGDDTIYLKDGGMVRGTIVDLLPGAQARVQLVTGEVDTIPWPEIDHVARSAAPPASGTAGSQSPAPYEVWVHIEAPEGVVVEQDVTNNDGWQPVCTAPCDRPLPTAFNYRVTGGGIRSSGDFTLSGAAGSHERLVVDAASKSAFILGVVAMAGGSVVAYVGLFTAYAAELSSTFETSDSTSGTLGAGVTMMAVGALAAVGGLVVALANGKTKVTVDAGGAPAGALSPSRLKLTAWDATRSEGRTLLPAYAGIPLFSGRF
jgi:hypothetical protein